MNKVRFNVYNNYSLINSPYNTVSLKVSYEGYEDCLEALRVNIDKDGRVVDNGSLKGCIDLNYYIAMGKVCEVVKQLDGSDLLKELYKYMSELENKLDTELDIIYSKIKYSGVDVKDVYAELFDLRSRRKRLRNEDKIKSIEKEIEEKRKEYNDINKRNIELERMLELDMFNIRKDTISKIEMYFKNFNDNIILSDNSI
ncbi:MAG: hypothetical protein RR359_04465 [Bacilli bacterium]